MKRASIYILVAFLAIAFAVWWNRQNRSDGGFAEARTALFEGRYADAAEGFDAFLRAGTNEDLASRATFLLGKCHLGSGDSAEARKWFEKTIDEFATSEEANKAIFKLAMMDYLEGDMIASQKRLQRIVARADGPYTPESMAWLRFLDRQINVDRDNVDREGGEVTGSFETTVP